MKQYIRILMVYCTLFSAVFFATVAAGQDAQPVFSQPVITLEIGTENYSGVLGDYCWLKAPEDIDCGYPARQPISSAIAVAPDTQVLVRLLTDAGAPTRFTATFLDSRRPDGDVRAVDLALGEDAQLPLDGLTGLQRVDIIAQYASTSGDENFVLYSFLLDVSTQGAVSDPQTVVEPTQLPIVEQPTEALVVVEPPTQLPEVMPTAVAAVPVESAGSPSTPLLTGDSVTFTVARPPALVLRGASETFEPIAQAYSARDPRGATLRVDEPVAPSGRRLTVPSGGFFVIASPVPADLFQVTVLQDDQQVVSRGVVPGDRLARYALNVPAGNYLIAVEATFPSGTVVYTFRVAVV